MWDYPFFPLLAGFRAIPWGLALSKTLTEIKKSGYTVYIKGVRHTFFSKKYLLNMVEFMNVVDEAERKVLIQDLKRLDAKKESLTKQLKETNQEIDKLEKKLKEMSRK